MRWLAVLGLCAMFAVAVNGFLLPEPSPHVFLEGEVVPINVNSLTSYEGHLPYEYYSLPFCKPEDGVKAVDTSFNPGHHLSGLQIYKSPYEVRMNVHEPLKQACTPGATGPLTSQQVQDFREKIDGRYHTRLVLDNLPITTYELSQYTTSVSPGFDLGVKAEDQYVVFNHLALNVLIKKVPGSGPLRHSSPHGKGSNKAGTAPRWMIVGLEVMPCSIKRTKGEPLEQIHCRPWDGKENPEPQVVAEGEDIVYTYDVYWQEADIEWVNRWDAYMRPPPSIVFHVGLYAAVPLLVMLSMLWSVIRRTTAVDPPADARARTEEEVVAQQQWKRLAGDVFRAPPDAGTLAYRTATGAQLLCAAAAALALTAAGALAPARRGAFLTAAPALYCGLSAVGGFVAVALLRSTQHSTQHGMPHWTFVCLKTATFFPGVAFILYATVATAATAAGSALAATPAVYAYLAALWLTVGVPLTFLGGALALRAPLPTWPAATHKAPPSEAPAPTPLAMWCTRCRLYLGAVLFPAWAFFFALNPLMQSVWNGYFFGAPITLLAVSAVTVTCCAGSSVLCTYKQLCAGDSDWWWPAFRRGGAVAVPLLMHAVIFRAVDLPALHGAGLLLYGCYMATVALAVYLCLGAVGFVASLVFVYCAYTRLADAEVAATATDGDAAALREKLLKWEPDAAHV